MSCANYGIYMTTCSLCKRHYVGQAKNKFSIRWTTQNDLHKPTEKEEDALTKHDTQ